MKTISWENKKENLPKLAILHNGWEIHFFSSNAKPPAGSAIDGCWLDEEIQDPDWYPEIAARLVDKEGEFFWSATPQAGTEQLFELHMRAEEQARWPKEQRLIEEFHFLIDENTHITDKQKQDFASKLSPDEFAVRILGEFALHSYRVYPEFNHTQFIVPFFVIPNNWTAYAAIDPGRQVCATLFMAIPPPDDGDYGYLFDELYIHNCSAEIFAQAMADKCRGRTIEAFIIDRMESRKYETGSGRTIEEQYSDALERHKVKCERTGNFFTPGAADPKAGAEAVRAWLRARENAGPKLRVLSDRVPNFIFEMDRYRYKKDAKGTITDVPDDRGAVHLMACLRYLIQDEPVYREPKKGTPRESGIVKFARDLMKGSRKNDGILHLGPGVGA